MADLGDVSREVVVPDVRIALTIPGALGMGNNDYSREISPKSGGGGTPPGPTIPSYGQIFPRGLG